MKLQLLGSADKNEWTPIKDNNNKDIIIDLDNLDNSIINLDENYDLCIITSYIKFKKIEDDKL